MKFFQNRLTLLVIGLIAVGIALVTFFTKEVVGDELLITAPVKKGKFEAAVYSTGQLQAERSVSINVPSELGGRRVGIYEIKIARLIDEGTVVDSGQFVAGLDQSAVEELLVQAREQLEKSLRSLEDAKIDTNINLSNLRDELINGKVSMEEKQLIVNQSIYESPSVKRQSALDLERAERKYQQDIKNFDLKKKQDVFKVQRALDDVQKQRERVNDIEKLIAALDVKAPQAGMVIYGTDRFGNKIKVGSTVSLWAPQIAQLPDLATMISKTYINEIDISRLKVGQVVKVGIDAFPDKSFDGKVTTVANIGQVLPGGDSKVFEVTVKVMGSDSELRPAMTTSNVITTDVLDSVMFIPLESVFKNDSLQYVIARHKGKLRKQIVDLGPMNENHVVVLSGVEENDEVLLNLIPSAEKLKFVGLEIFEQQQKRAEEKRAKEEEESKKAKEDAAAVDSLKVANEPVHSGNSKGIRVQRSGNSR
jgi:hypothetical protein